MSNYRLTLVGAAIILIQVIGAAFAPLITRYDPNATDYMALLQAPSWQHLLGTDDLGRDLFSRLLYGTRQSLAASIAAVILSVAIGMPLGLFSGYVGGWVDEFLMRMLDSVMALPHLVLALTIAAILGPGLTNAVIAIAVASVPTFARLSRGQALSLKSNDYISAAIMFGVPKRLILFRHILPNAVNPIIVQAMLAVGFAIITESSLSFIGLGAQPPASTWGSMIQIGFQYLQLAPWFVLAPATMIFLTVLGVNLLGDGLRESLDPLTKS